MDGRIELVSDEVHKLVFRCLDLIEQAQFKLGLPICAYLRETRERLKGGVFKVEPFIKNGTSKPRLNYALFKPPSTIVLNSRISTCERRLKIHGLYLPLAHYSVTHGVLRADDYTGGELLLQKTREHILSEHQDKLEKGMLIIQRNCGRKYIQGQDELAKLWALQYVDMVAHYRAFVVHRFNRLPKLDFIWALLRNDLFSPNLLTCLENRKGTRGVFDIITRLAGKYCLIEALGESEKMLEQNVSSYVI